MKKFEIKDTTSMQAIKALEANTEFITAIAMASEITIDIYGNVEFTEAAEAACHIQQLNHEEAEVIFKVTPKQGLESEIKMMISVKER